MACFTKIECLTMKTKLKGFGVNFVGKTFVVFFFDFHISKLNSALAPLNDLLKIRPRAVIGAAEEQLSAAPLVVACAWLVRQIFLFFVFHRSFGGKEKNSYKKQNLENEPCASNSK